MKILKANRITPDGTYIWGYSVCLCPIKGTPGLNELKWSADISKITSLSVKRVLSSALSNVVTPELFGPYLVFSASLSFFLSLLDLPAKG